MAVSDADSDTLSYQWRATAGTIDNRNAATTVWTLPAGPGLHFAYVLVSDGRGGYSERQYAVSTDALKINAPARTAVTYAPAPATKVTDAGVVLRLRATTPTALPFADAGAGAGNRSVYLSDMPVAVTVKGTGTVVFSGTTDAAGELNLPNLKDGSYTVNCATTSGGPLRSCGDLTVNATSSSVAPLEPSIGAGSNLRLYGHVALADGGVCGTRNDYFGIYASATVQLQQADGQAVTPARRVNRFGDYFIDAAVANNTPLKLRIQCGSDVHIADVLPGAGGFLSVSPLEVSHVTGNRRPAITRMIANGPDGNVRGREVLAEAGAISNTLPGFERFLTYKGTDTALSACMYYRAIGAVSGCNTQGGMENPITFDDWKKHHLFGTGKNPEPAATYINQRDLNLVRRMFATKVSDTQVAFYVCNNPGPEGRTQAEVNEVIDFGLASERRVACVAMEWSTAPGVQGGNTPFTKFLTFGPDGSLIPSVNLDGRGEKFMPGACIACHGGSKIGGRFPDRGNPSPFLGSRFLGFDTGNYLFSTVASLTEADQGKALRDLNELVQHTEGGPSSITATAKLINGWYASGGNQLDKAYVPTPWQAPADKAQFYREVIGTSCRTCHAALGSAEDRFDWDSQPNLFTGSTDPSNNMYRHVCGGTPELAVNGSMPNALASLDRLLDSSAPGIDALRARMKKYLGCSAPAEDPVYPRR
ncbi:hypothetical protein [Polaromonas sp. CG9_12]|nr:hypothetical protein [Polaromonas sp. CG9_12]